MRPTIPLCGAVLAATIVAAAGCEPQAGEPNAKPATLNGATLNGAAPEPAAIAPIEPGTKIDLMALPAGTHLVFRSRPKLTSGDVTKVGPTLIKQVLSAKARLEDGETAILGIDRENRELTGQGGTPWLSDIPFFGWLFKARGERASDVRLVIAARARRISSPAELVADTIRRRLVFERQRLREVNMPSGEGAPYGVRVTTRAIEDDATAIAQDLERRGHAVQVHRWEGTDRRPLWDVYVRGLDSLAAAGDLAQRLADDGWDADLVVFPPRS